MADPLKLPNVGLVEALAITASLVGPGEHKGIAPTTKVLGQE